MTERTVINIAPIDRREAMVKAPATRSVDDLLSCIEQAVGRGGLCPPLVSRPYIQQRTLIIGRWSFCVVKAQGPVRSGSAPSIVTQVLGACLPSMQDQFIVSGLARDQRHCAPTKEAGAWRAERACRSARIWLYTNLPTFCVPAFALHIDVKPVEVTNSHCSFLRP
eukprot:6183057-Pleurochrysis_carterae.AAC.1